jgi:hypothetical protein
VRGGCEEELYVRRSCEEELALLLGWAELGAAGWVARGRELAA